MYEAEVGITPSPLAEVARCTFFSVSSTSSPWILLRALYLCQHVPFIILNRDNVKRAVAKARVITLTMLRGEWEGEQPSTWMKSEGMERSDPVHKHKLVMLLHMPSPQPSLIIHELY
jgi:hypothetical protein